MNRKIGAAIAALLLAASAIAVSGGVATSTDAGARVQPHGGFKGMG